MNVENHINNAKNMLDLAQEDIAAGKYHTALHAEAAAYADVRELMQHTYELDRENLKAEALAGEDVT